MENMTNILIKTLIDTFWYLVPILLVVGIITLALAIGKYIKRNKNKENELKAKELYLKYKEVELKEKEFNSKNKIEFEEKKVITKKEFRIYTEEEKKAYALKIKNLKEKGRKYEEFIGNNFKTDGYNVILNGINKNKKDKGIDIICTKDEELILIQCKNWEINNKYKIKHETLKAFVGCCTEYVNENKLFDKKIKLKFITSNYIIDESGKNFLKGSKTLKYEVVEFKE